MKYVGGDNIEQHGDKNRASVTHNDEALLRWFQRPIGIIILTIIGGVIIAGIVWKLGWV